MAVVHRRMPFMIRLKERADGEVQPVRLKIDPGSKITGMALAREDGGVQHTLFLAEVEHRGRLIRKKLGQRSAYRRRRRSANLRYRSPRFLNRTKPTGWLAPSLKHRVDTTLSWVERLRKLAPVSALTQELVRFDTQLLENPEISGVEYQRGTLYGYEIREYVFEKWGRTCVYCGAKNTPLNLDHVEARSRGGSNRASNLVPACIPCNKAKDNRSIQEFLKNQPGKLLKIWAAMKRPLRDAAAVNATRFALLGELKSTGLSVEISTGGRTKYNRSRLVVPKTHALDAACTGEFSTLHGWQIPTIVVRCTGRGSYQRTRVTAHGFPRGFLMRNKCVFGFATGDLVAAIVPTGKNKGEYVGRVAVRARGYFNISTADGLVKDVAHRHCQLLQRGDGFGYYYQPGIVAQKQLATFSPILDIA